jgi:hypothetical protein
VICQISPAAGVPLRFTIASVGVERFDRLDAADVRAVDADVRVWKVLPFAVDDDQHAAVVSRAVNTSARASV